MSQKWLWVHVILLPYILTSFTSLYTNIQRGEVSDSVTECWLWNLEVLGTKMQRNRVILKQCAVKWINQCISSSMQFN